MNKIIQIINLQEISMNIQTNTNLEIMTIILEIGLAWTLPHQKQVYKSKNILG